MKIVTCLAAAIILLAPVRGWTMTIDEWFANAAKAGNTASIEMMINHKVPVDIRKDESHEHEEESAGVKTADDHTMVSGDFHMETNGATALMIASKEGRLETARFLLAKGADVNAQNPQGETPLMLAAMEGRTDIVELLYRYRAKPDIKDRSGRTALIWAAKNGRNDTVQFMIQAKINPNVTDNDGASPLMWAAKEGRQTTVDLLAKHGANLELRNTNEDNAIIWAALNGHAETIQVLIRRGANVNAKDKQNRTPFMRIKREADFQRVIEAMKKAGARES